MPFLTVSFFGEGSLAKIDRKKLVPLFYPLYWEDLVDVLGVGNDPCRGVGKEPRLWSPLRGNHQALRQGWFIGIIFFRSPAYRSSKLRSVREPHGCAP